MRVSSSAADKGHNTGQCNSVHTVCPGSLAGEMPILWIFNFSEGDPVFVCNLLMIWHDNLNKLPVWYQKMLRNQYQILSLLWFVLGHGYIICLQLWEFYRFASSLIVSKARRDNPRQLAMIISRWSWRQIVSFLLRLPRIGFLLQCKAWRVWLSKQNLCPNIW